MASSWPTVFAAGFGLHNVLWPTVLAAGWTNLGSRLRRTWAMIKRTVTIQVDVFSYKILTLTFLLWDQSKTTGKTNQMKLLMRPTDLQQSPTPWPVLGLQSLQQVLAYTTFSGLWCLQQVGQIFAAVA